MPTIVSPQPVPTTNWWIFLLEGIGAILFGILLLTSPATTVVAITIFLGLSKRLEEDCSDSFAAAIPVCAGIEWLTGACRTEKGCASKILIYTRLADGVRATSKCSGDLS